MDSTTNFAPALRDEIFGHIARCGAYLGCDVYVVGGWVRDIMLDRKSTDIDVVVVGNGIELATAVGKMAGSSRSVKVYKNFGTAMLQHGDWHVEFVGARKESYRADSRKPVVEGGTLHDDLSRRDFTINALAISLNASDYGRLIDLYGGMDDLQKKIIRTPLAADITYSDDPLRMMRAIRFASQLGFTIEAASFKAIQANAQRLKIVSEERIMDEFNKIMMSDAPGAGIIKLRQAGLLKVFFPELEALAGIDIIDGKGHKDNFFHTLQVLDNLSANTHDLWLRWAALLHDIAKPPTKKFDPVAGWTFHGHEFLGAKMIPAIFRRLKLPMHEKMKYVQKLVLLHLRPIALTESVVTDSAVRRLLFEAGDDIDDLMMLCEADITSGNPDKVKRYLANFELVRSKLSDIEAADKIRNWQPPVSGEDIMEAFALKPCREVGIIKTAIREAILDGIIANDREAALDLMYAQGKKLGLIKQGDRNND